MLRKAQVSSVMRRSKFLTDNEVKVNEQIIIFFMNEQINCLGRKDLTFLCKIWHEGGLPHHTMMNAKSDFKRKIRIF